MTSTEISGVRLGLESTRPGVRLANPGVQMNPAVKESEVSASRMPKPPPSMIVAVIGAPGKSGGRPSGKKPGTVVAAQLSATRCEMPPAASSAPQLMQGSMKRWLRKEVWFSRYSSNSAGVRKDVPLLARNRTLSVICQLRPTL